MSNNLNSTIMTTNNSILVDNVRSNKSDNMVWAVYAGLYMPRVMNSRHAIASHPTLQ